MPEQLVQAACGSADCLSVGLIVGNGGQTTEGEAIHCGVRDYATRLAQALGNVGINARVLAPSSWAVRPVSAFLASLRGERLDVLHLQYPSIGYRYSLLPHVMGLAGLSGHCLVTLHEHSALTRVQRAANRLFRLTADGLVFTTAFEAAAFGMGETCVIPIGSNIPVHRGNPPRSDTVLYFGQVRPGRGLEEFLTLARLAAAANITAQFLVLGSTPPRWRSYRDALQSNSPLVAWVADVTSERAAEILATARAAYLPFPDCVSYRRASLLAALSNGLPVISPCGPDTPAELAAVVLSAQNPQAALEHVVNLGRVPDLASSYGTAGQGLALQFDWSEIAAKHVALYQQVVRECPGLRRSVWSHSKWQQRAPPISRSSTV